MRIDVWADVVCPWCYLGTHRLRQAAADLSGELSGDVEVVLHSFQLDPSTPTPSTQTVVDYLGERYGGGPEGARQMVAQVEALALEDGLHLHHASSPRSNSGDAHRLLHLALEDSPARQARLAELLYAAYFTDARDIADHEVLRELAATAGLEPSRVEEVLAGHEFADDVERDQQRAAAMGVSGVPFFVLAEKYAVSGAQPTAVMRQVLEQVAAGSVD
jgi:predicted DsbA family dithiol-disulfide isomerase